MKCEGDKLYDQQGNCPVCNMHLVPLVDNSRNIFTIRTVSVIDCYMYVKQKRGYLIL